ncbi:tryptophan 7-halogenase [Acinetobacter haemolyticus]|uniref:tryptophan 7-halogenase n=1 Tax=Acinetobacter haemolyticus TaxID=29430 RepID=UPI000E1497EF|nr:tryptophan 7-halogenase [Acinetobacter haemolyticus]SUU24356.1 geranylgeranyl reductase family [Acinetobacter haemolyticus]
MLNLRGMKRVCVIGGGTAGWFAALHMRQLFSPAVEIILVSSSEIPIVGVGEGGTLTLMQSLVELGIPFYEFLEETSAVHKLGFAYEGWRDSNKNKKDIYYHMFPLMRNDIFFKENDYYPAFSALLNHDIPISYAVDSIELRENNVSQQELTKMLISKSKENFASSFHFDTYKVGQYLKKIAIQRGVIHREGMFREVVQDAETGLVTAIQVDDIIIDVDFLIDATGFSKQIIGNKLKGAWQSFKEYLPQNTAIPFHLKHRRKNPDLVTLSTAMNAGWVWQIPLQERIGAGYVFNRDFITPDQAVEEIEQWLGYEIEPIKTISFEAGCYEEVWKGNVLAIGLASGFIEPLEATSIGQMLSQLDFFVRIVKASHGIISQQSIKLFNKENVQCWYGIRDFIRMHYDSGRVDTEFWRVTQQLPLSDHYQALKECWKHRTPRNLDFYDYEMDGYSPFNIYSWLAIGQALGVVKAEASVAELYALAPEKKQKVAQYLSIIKQRYMI